jgi:hypothetical protein
MNPDVLKVKELLQTWGNVFANECRKYPGKGKYHGFDPVRKSEMRWALGGLQPDECKAFLKAYQAKPEIVRFNPNGSFTMRGKRNSEKGPYHILGRYGDHITNFAEYLTHISAFGELVLDHGWLLEDVVFEKGEFDILGYDNTEKSMERAILLVEAKARVSAGNDSLESLRDSLINKAADPSYKITNRNHLHKWNELFSCLNSGPVYVWLVASGARWSYLAQKNGSHVKMERLSSSPDFKKVLAQTQVGGYVKKHPPNTGNLFAPFTRLATEFVARTAITLTYPEELRPSINVAATSPEEIETNIASATTGKPRAGRSWSNLEIEEAFIKGDDPTLRELFLFAKKHSDSGRFQANGSKKAASFGFYIKGRRKVGSKHAVQVFSCSIDYSRVVLYLNMTASITPSNVLEIYRKKLLSLFGDSMDPDAKEPNVPISVVSEHLEGFKKAILWLESQIDTTVLA